MSRPDDLHVRGLAGVADLELEIVSSFSRWNWRLSCSPSRMCRSLPE
jgi:hypothetical protein